MKQFYKPLLCMVLLMVFSVSNTFAQTTVTSFTRLNNSPTAANMVTYDITFSTAVDNVSTSSFSLSTGGSIIGASIAAVSAISTTDYRVYINTGVYSGTITLKFTGMGISPSISTPLPLDGGTYSIDKTDPTVTSVTSTTANGTYKATNTINIVVNFSEDVTVTNIPQLKLKVGSTERTIDYSGGSGTSSLLFTYTVQNGENSSDLDYASTSSLSLQGGTIRDQVGRNAVLTLPSPGSAGSLGANKDIIIDTQAPILIITTDLLSLRAGETAAITFTFSEKLASFSEQQVTVTNGTLDYFSATANPMVYTAVFIPTASVNAGAANISVAAGSYSDLVGNSGEDAALSTIEYDTKTPTANISSDLSALKLNKTAVITITFSEAVVGFTFGDVAATNGMLSDFKPTADPLVYTVVFKPDNGIAYTSANIFISAGSYVDIVGNNGSGANTSIQVDTLVPTVLITSSAGTLGSTTTVKPIPFTITFSENVSGFISTDVSIINGTLDDFSGSGTTYNITVIPTAKGNVTVDVAANMVYDDFGNDNLASNEYVINYDGVLPVELANYAAKVEGNYAKLIWQTTSEQDNKSFEVYRSGDDKQFVKIGVLAAAVAYNSQPTTYNFTDKKPLNGNNYYRLVQVDQDGKVNELGERVVNFQLSTFQLQVYPNPTQEQVTVNFQAGKYSNLLLSDMNGKILQSYKLLPTITTSQLNLAKYAAGMYLVKLKGDQTEEVQKLIKQ